MTDTTLLRIKMLINNDTIKELANYLGSNRQNVSIKINGKRDFKQHEIAKIAERYSLTPEEIVAMFFKPEGVNGHV